MTPPKRSGPRGKRIDPAVLSGYLRRIREGLDLTQNQVAERAGIDRSLYNAYEGGRRVPEPENIGKVAGALNVAPEEILALAEKEGAVAELAVQLAALRSRVDQLETV